MFVAEKCYYFWWSPWLLNISLSLGRNYLAEIYQDLSLYISRYNSLDYMCVYSNQILLGELYKSC